MGQDVIRLLDSLSIDRAHLIGYSMGAQIAVQLLAEHQDRFNSGVLGGASGRWEWSAKDEQLAETEASEMEQRMLRSMLLRLAPPGTRPTEEQLQEESARRLQGLDTDALAAVRRSMRETVVP